MIATYWNYVVCNIDYRWILSDPLPWAPGSIEDRYDSGLVDENNETIWYGNEITDLIEDCFGALAWIKENIRNYKGDPNNIVVTGDSAGGHLAAMMTNYADKVGSEGFGITEGVYEFNPTYRNSTGFYIRV